MNAFNSDPRQKNPENTFFDDLYAGFHIQRISIFRSICSIAEKREAVNELVTEQCRMGKVTDFQMLETRFCPTLGKRKLTG